MNEQIKNFLGASNMYGMYETGSLLPIARDNRTNREKLMDKKKYNEDMIKKLEFENDQINEALELMDKHPFVEKINDLIRKLIR